MFSEHCFLLQYDSTPVPQRKGSQGPIGDCGVTSGRGSLGLAGRWVPLGRSSSLLEVRTPAIHEIETSQEVVKPAVMMIESGGDNTIYGEALYLWGQSNRCRLQGDILFRE